jgi:peptidyl-prolyl cis-trans isomerase D
MLKEMRQNTKTILWIVIVAFVGLIVVGWGMQQRTGKGGPEAGYVGSVGGTRITTEEYRDEIENQRAAYVQQYGRPKGAEDEKRILESVWESIIRRHILWSKVDDWGIITTDEEVLREIQYNPPPFIRSHPAFMTDSLFDHQKYIEALRDPRVDFSFLENYVRQTLPFSRLENYLAGCVRVTDEEVLTLVRLFQEKTVITYVRVSPFTDVQDEAAEPTDTDLRTYYEANREDFRIPEKRVLRYVSIPKEPGIQDKRFARERIEEAYDLVYAGDSFEEIAVLYSDDQNSAEKGGDLGWIREGRLPPEADSVVFDLEPGEMSDIIEIQRAYHFFRVMDARETDGVREVRLSQVMALADVSPATVEMLMSNAEDLAASARDRGLDEAADEMEYVVEEADQVTLEAAAGRLATDDAAAEEVFSAAAGEVIGPIDGRGIISVVQVVSATPTYIPSFEDARSSVERARGLHVRTEAARAKAEAVAADLEAGATLEAAADRQGLRVRTTVPFTRMTDVPGIGGANEITGAAFAISEGETAGPIEHAGSFFVFRVDLREPYDQAQVDREFGSLKMSAVLSKQQGFVGDWYEAAKMNVEVEDYRGAGY